jgi:hypothetical protein
MGIQHLHNCQSLLMWSLFSAYGPCVRVVCSSVRNGVRRERHASPGLEELWSLR